MKDLRFGTSTHAHAVQMLEEVEAALALVAPRIRDGVFTAMSEAEVSRHLAGIVGRCEGLRCWLGTL